MPSVAPLPAAASRELSESLLQALVASPVARVPALERPRKIPSTFRRHFVVSVRDFVSCSHSHSMVSFVCVHVHSFKNPATSPLTFFFLLSVPVSPFAEGMANCTFLAAVNNATSVQCGADNADEVCCTKHPDPGPINCFDGDPSATAEPGGDGEENQYY